MLGHVTAAPAQSFAVFDAPNALTVSSSINARVDVTGFFNDGKGGHGFVRDAAGNITVFDSPGIALLSVTSINASGEVTGSFIPFSNPFRQSGFVRDASGNITVFDAPNADEPIQFGTQSLNINAAGAVTGSFQDQSQFDKRRGFVRDQFGNFTVFDGPGSFPLGYGPQTATFGTSINAGGAVTGYFTDPSQGGKTRGFVRDAAGNITVFDAPDGLQTASSSINEGGAVTGSFIGTTSIQRGFVRDAAGNNRRFRCPQRGRDGQLQYQRTG